MTLGCYNNIASWSSEWQYWSFYGTSHWIIWMIHLALQDNYSYWMLYSLQFVVLCITFRYVSTIYLCCWTSVISGHNGSYYLYSKNFESNSFLHSGIHLSLVLWPTHVHWQPNYPGHGVYWITLMIAIAASLIKTYIFRLLHVLGLNIYLCKCADCIISSLYSIY